MKMHYGLILLFSLPAFAADTVLLDPAKTTCEVVKGDELGTLKCNVLHGGKLVHRGRSMSEPFANGDCVKCEGVVAAAFASRKKIRMLRDTSGRDYFDWDRDSFFTVNGEDTCD